MARFKTKPFEIEAVQFTGDNEAEVQAMTGSQYFYVLEDDEKTDDPDMAATVFDFLHSTWVGVYPNQWIIKGQKGEFYPCDPEIFEAKYEPLRPHDEHVHVGFITKAKMQRLGTEDGDADGRIV